MPRIVQARGLPCPQPVLLTKKAMQEADDILTIVDGPEQAENVARMARQAGWQVEVDGKEEAVYVRLVRPQEAPQVQKEEARPTAGPLVLMVPGETMGRGESAELGHVLIRAFFHTLLEIERRPDVIIFYNSGVRLVVEGSPILEDLRALAEQGVQILACGTCLGYFDLKDRVAVGTVSNMYAIAETLLGAGRVVSL
ncbi:MAG: sulfurtransferase-like selenium metabolism protein YedF [Chloroflexia bacterium]